MTTTLDNLWKKGTNFLGTKYAIMCGAMSWVSEHNLVSAISNAGGFGVIACGALTPEQLRHEIKMTKILTQNPFGVNVITMHPQANDLIQMCLDEGVSHIVLAGGLPKVSMIQKAKQANAKVMCFAPTLSIAARLLSSGVDALVIEGSEAGGHIGPTSTAVLAQMILPHIKNVPVFVAGGIGRGDMMVSYLMMGAAGCQLGTRFVCTHESIAHPNFKNAFIKATARDSTVSVQVDPSFPVIPVRSIANKATQAFATAQSEAIISYKKGELTKTEAQLKIEKFWAGALKRAVIDGDVEHGSLMAGESVDMVTREQSTQEVINELLDQAEAFLASHAAGCASQKIVCASATSPNIS